MTALKQAEMLRNIKLDSVRNFVTIVHDIDVSNDSLFQGVVRTALDVCSITPNELANKLGVSPTSISRWKSGKNLPHVLGRSTVVEVMYENAKAELESLV